MNSRFRLQSLLKLRRAERDRCRATLAEAQRADDQLRVEAERWQEQFDRLSADSYALHGPGPLDAGRILQARRFQTAVARRLETSQQRRAQLAVEIDQRRHEVVQAHRQLVLLQRLCDRQQQAVAENQQRLEQRRLDDVAARIHLQHQGSSP